MRQTKEELLKVNKKLVSENANLQIELVDAKRRLTTERIRKEFAKAFNWMKSGAYAYNGQEPLVPTWEEIFVKIGSLINRVDEVNRIKAIEDTIPGFNDRLFYLENLIKEKK